MPRAPAGPGLPWQERPGWLQVPRCVQKMTLRPASQKPGLQEYCTIIPGRKGASCCPMRCPFNISGGGGHTKGKSVNTERRAVRGKTDRCSCRLGTVRGESQRPGAAGPQEGTQPALQEPKV